MADLEMVIKGLEILKNGCEYIDCYDCCFYISTKPTRCGLREEQIQEDARALLKEQQEQIDKLLEESASNAEMAEGMKELLKEQEAVKPTWQQGKAYCGSCGRRIPLKIGARFCHKCGRQVSWK